MISVHESVHELLSPVPVVPDPAPVEPGMRTVAGHVGVGIPTTDQKVGGWNPSGRATSYAL